MSDDAPPAATAPVQPVVGTPAAPAPSPAPASAVETGAGAADPEITLAIQAPFYVGAFDSKVVGWSPITQDGTTGPGESESQVVAAAATAGITLMRR